MNRFGGADLLIHSCAHGGLDARHGRHFDLTPRGDVVAVGLSDILDDGLLPGRT